MVLVDYKHQSVNNLEDKAGWNGVIIFQNGYITDLIFLYPFLNFFLYIKRII
jgi:hypothetical protein